MRFLGVFLALLIGTAYAQTITSATFGLNLATPGTTTVKVFASIVRMWDGTYNGVGVHWSDIETCAAASSNPSDPCYNWTGFDGIVAKAKANGQAIVYTLGQIPGWANGNQNQSVPPTNFQSIYTFVQAVFNRVAQDGYSIAYFGVWNEASYCCASQAYWSGTVAQMVTIAQNVETIAHAAGALVLTPSVAGVAGMPWMESYFAAGGGAYADLLDVHFYAYIGANSTEGSPLVSYPEQMWSLLQWYNAIKAAYSIGLPLFASEGSWATTASLPSPNGQTAFAGLWLLYMGCAGVERALWYEYEGGGEGYGTLSDGASWLAPQGVAFRVMESWLVGNVCSSPPARVTGTNQIRNTTGTGLVAGTPGTPPANWAVSNPDNSYGMSTTLGSGTEGGIPYVSLRVFGMPTAGAVGYAQIYFETGTHIAATFGQQWAEGVYVKLINATANNAGCTVWLAGNENNSAGNYLNATLYLPVAPTGAPLADDVQFWQWKTSQASVAYVSPYLSIQYTVGTPCDITLEIAPQTMDTGSEWSATLSSGQIVWDSAGGPTSYSTSYSRVMDLTGQQALVSGGSVTLKNLPVLLSNGVRVGWAP